MDSRAHGARGLRRRSRSALVARAGARELRPALGESRLGRVPRSRRECLLLAAALLSGCARFPRLGPDSFGQWESRRRRLALLADFSFVGRLTFRSSREALSARIRWRQAGEGYRIRLGGPMGGTALELRGDSDGVTLHGGDGVHYARSPESLLLEHTGWSIPLRGLRYWVLGIVSPDGEAEGLELDREGRLARIVQSGWRIAYRRYAKVQDLDLPSRIDLERAGFEARLVVERWTLGA